jgi:hypothetical protein
MFVKTVEAAQALVKDFQEPVREWFATEVRAYNSRGFEKDVKIDEENEMKKQVARRKVILSIAREHIQELTIAVQEISALDGSSPMILIGLDYIRAFKVMVYYPLDNHINLYIIFYR